MKRIVLPQAGIETLYGARDANLKHVESLFRVSIRTQGDELIVTGDSGDEQRVVKLFEQLSGLIEDGYALVNGDVKTAAQLFAQNSSVDLRDYFNRGGPAQGGQAGQVTKRRVNPKSVNQRRYLDAIDKFDIVFGVGPAGTGKTYLAMAQAVQYLLAKKVSRVILARPAVEAGEKLGFLPGDLQEKVNPYLRPLYDALYDMMDTEKATRLVERGTIEVAPIAFMRGRTLNDAFVILDEAQNTTAEQMKMFLTRLGFGSKAVVTGDITQIDLPNPKASGLVQALRIVKHVEGIGFIYFDDTDVVRHKLVQQIVKAYDAYNPTASMSDPGLRVEVVGAGDGALALGRWLRRVAPARARGLGHRGGGARPPGPRAEPQFRGVDAATDVLSFPAGEPGTLGDVVIARGRRRPSGARRRARSRHRAAGARPARPAAPSRLRSRARRRADGPGRGPAAPQGRPARGADRARGPAPFADAGAPPGHDAARALPRRLCRDLSRHGADCVQRPDAAVAAPHGRARRAQRAARAVSRRPALSLHSGTHPHRPGHGAGRGAHRPVERHPEPAVGDACSSSRSWRSSSPAST